MSNVHDLTPKNPYLGTWRSCDGFSDVEYTIAIEDGRLTVSGFDKADGEAAEIRNVAWSAGTSTLTFEAYWPSSGQLTKYRFAPAPRSGRANVTYSYTAQETWERT
jgi:hypothetical protein